MKAQDIESKKVLITGSNKGLGYGILKNLSKRPEKHTFIMAIRDLNNGKKAIEELSKEIPDIASRIELLELDIANKNSIMNAIKILESKNTKIDCVINNAAIAFNDLFVMNEERAKKLLDTNFYGTVEFTNSISPFINNNGKIIFIGSLGGSLEILKSEKLVNQFLDSNLTMSKLFELAQKYLLDVKNNQFEQEGWPKYPYGISKLFVHFYAKLLSADPLYIKRNIQIYSCHPGTIDTDLTKNVQGIKNIPNIITVDEGAIAPCYIFDLPWTINENQGCFFNKCVKATFKEKIFIKL